LRKRISVSFRTGGAGIRFVICLKKTEQCPAVQSADSHAGGRPASDGGRARFLPQSTGVLFDLIRRSDSAWNCDTGERMIPRSRELRRINVAGRLADEVLGSERDKKPCIR
jgi:hypothetical protein